MTGVRYCLLLWFLSFLGIAVAADFKTVSEPVALLYRAPSKAADRLRIVSYGYPLEEVVALRVGWSKVRDQEGVLAWIPTEHLHDRGRFVLMVRSDFLYHTASVSSVKRLGLEEGVLLEVLGASELPGWIRVRHTSLNQLGSQAETKSQAAVEGFVPFASTWGR